MGHLVPLGRWDHWYDPTPWIINTNELLHLFLHSLKMRINCQSSIDCIHHASISDLTMHVASSYYDQSIKISKLISTRQLPANMKCTNIPKCGPSLPNEPRLKHVTCRKQVYYSNWELTNSKINQARAFVQYPKEQHNIIKKSIKVNKF